MPYFTAIARKAGRRRRRGCYTGRKRTRASGRTPATAAVVTNCPLVREKCAPRGEGEECGVQGVHDLARTFRHSAPVSGHFYFRLRRPRLGLWPLIPRL